MAVTKYCWYLKEVLRTNFGGVGGRSSVVGTEELLVRSFFWHLDIIDGKQMNNGKTTPNRDQCAFEVTSEKALE